MVCLGFSYLFSWNRASALFLHLSMVSLSKDAAIESAISEHSFDLASVEAVRERDKARVSASSGVVGDGKFILWLVSNLNRH